MLKTEIDNYLKNAIKNQNEVEKDIFRLLKGEISLIEAREGKEITDDKVVTIINKFILANETTLGHLPKDDSRREKLNAEICILTHLLPEMMTIEETQEEIVKNPDLLDSIKKANSDGQAIGLAVKFFKGTDLKVEGKIISCAVANLRH